MGATAITQPRAQLGQLSRWLIRAVALVSAFGLALVISGVVFQFIPGTTLAHIRGKSMEPHYHDGDVVLLRRFSHPTAVEKGDIVLFRYKAVHISHRVIEVGPDAGAATRIVTKGDNNPVADPPLKLSDVEARVLVEVPLLGEVSRALGAGGGVYVYRYGALLAALAFVLVYAAVSLVRLRSQIGGRQADLRGSAFETAPTLES